MNYITGHWSFDPFLIIAVILAGWHEIGLARLASQSPPERPRGGLADARALTSTERTRQRRLRSVAFYGGLAVLLIAVESPVEYWANDYFFMHMVQHLLLMFAAPTLVVAGAPWQPLLEGLPSRLRRSITAAVMLGWSRPLRAVGGWLVRPWVSVTAFSVVMVAWHIPALLDLAENNHAVQIWLMHASFFTAGVLFWLQFIPSPPFRMRMPLVSQALAIGATNVIMWILAMSMSLLARGSWYPVYDHIPGVTMAPFADQQIGAGILWVCGDFWAIPTLVIIVRRIIAQDGSVGAAVDKILGRAASPSGGPRAGSGWASRAGR
jgi:putative membrane protein